MALYNHILSYCLKYNWSNFSLSIFFIAATLSLYESFLETLKVHRTNHFVFFFFQSSHARRGLIIKRARERFYGRITRESYTLISVKINDTHSLLELLFNGRLSHSLARHRVEKDRSPERTPREIMRLRHCESFREMGRASSRETFTEWATCRGTR